MSEKNKRRYPLFKYEADGFFYAKSEEVAEETLFYLFPEFIVSCVRIEEVDIENTEDDIEKEDEDIEK